MISLETFGIIFVISILIILILFVGYMCINNYIHEKNATIIKSNGLKSDYSEYFYNILKKHGVNIDFICNKCNSRTFLRTYHDFVDCFEKYENYKQCYQEGGNLIDQYTLWCWGNFNAHKRFIGENPQHCRYCNENLNEFIYSELVPSDKQPHNCGEKECPLSEVHNFPKCQEHLFFFFHKAIKCEECDEYICNECSHKHNIENRNVYTKKDLLKDIKKKLIKCCFKSKDS